MATKVKKQPEAVKPAYAPSPVPEDGSPSPAAFDCNGWVLCIDDKVFVEKADGNQRRYRQQAGHIVSIGQSNRTAMVKLPEAEDLLRMPVQFLRWDGYLDRFTRKDEQPCTAGDRVRVVHLSQTDPEYGELGIVERIDENAPHCDLALVAFENSSLGETLFQVTDLVRESPAPVAAAPVPVEQEPDLPFFEPKAPAAAPASPLGFGQLNEMASGYRAGLRLLHIGSIVVTRNTRKVFDEAALAELAESVKAHGILQPIVVRPMGELKFELVAGERRYRAAVLAGLEHMPATVRTLTDREFLEVQLLENLQRVDVRPADEAQAFAELLKNGYSAEEIGLKVGKGEKFVLQRAKLASLIPFWFDALAEGRLLLVSGNELARLPAHSQLTVKQSFGNNDYPKGYPAREISSKIESKVTRNLEKASWDKADATLVPSAGPCTTCPKRSGAQALLFDSEESLNLCLDGGCFATKLGAAMARRLAEVTVELGSAPLRVTTNYYADADQKVAGIVEYSSYNWSHEGAIGAVQVLVVDGADAGQLKYVHLAGMAAMKHGQAMKTAEEKAADALRIRKERTRKMHRSLLAEALTLDLPLHLNNDGPAAHAVLAHFIMEELSGRAEAKLDYLKTSWGWEPTAQESETGWNTRDEQGRTPWMRYVLGKAAELTLLQKQYLYFTLKVRHRMDHEYEDLQFSIADIAGSYSQVATEAEQAVELRYYTKKGKKQEVPA